jgi:hypothetical protein
MTKKIYLVITSINNVSKILKKISHYCKKYQVNFIIVGDKKGPNNKNFNLNNVSYFDLSEQKKLKLNFEKICPKNSYSRKNIGYLLAMRGNSDVIIDSDDDNIPGKNFFLNFSEKQKFLKLHDKGWVNIYKYFDKKKKIIWPRGFPLDEIKKNSNFNGKIISADLPVQQYLTNGDPDVDAIHRMLIGKKNFKFLKKLPLGIGKKSFVPFNSQNTRWFKKSFPLMYLPSTCSFRSTDIFRSFIALRILHANNLHLGYFSASNRQLRNVHDLKKDFSNEIEIYRDSKKMVKILYETKIPAGEKNFNECLVILYKKLISYNLFSDKELVLLNKWIEDYNSIYIK